MFSETSVNLSEGGKKNKLQVNKRHIVSDTAKRQLTEGYRHTNPPTPLPKKPETENTTTHSQNQANKRRRVKRLKCNTDLTGTYFVSCPLFLLLSTPLYVTAASFLLL